MKHRLALLSILALAPWMISASITWPGDGADGWDDLGDDTVNAAVLNEIKTQVDDNDARIDNLLVTDTQTVGVPNFTAGALVAGSPILSGASTIIIPLTKTWLSPDGSNGACWELGFPSVNGTTVVRIDGFATGGGTATVRFDKRDQDGVSNSTTLEAAITFDASGEERGTGASNAIDSGVITAERKLCPVFTAIDNTGGPVDQVSMTIWVQRPFQMP